MSNFEMNKQMVEKLMTGALNESPFENFGNQLRCKVNELKFETNPDFLVGRWHGKEIWRLAVPKIYKRDSLTVISNFWIDVNIVT